MKKVLVITLLVFSFSLFYAADKTACNPFKIDVPSNILKLVQNADTIFSSEIKTRPEFEVIGPDKIADIVKKKPDLFTGLSGIQKLLRSAGLAGADYLIMGNITYKDKKIDVTVSMIDTLTGRDIWDDEVWTADTASDKGFINAVKMVLERLVRKMGGQTVSAYSELGENKTTESGYQVKLNISVLQHKKMWEKYRYELIPYGEVTDDTNIIVAGMKDYTYFVYNDSRSGMLIYSNTVYMDENKDINPVDNTVTVKISEIGDKRAGDNYRLVLEPGGEARENSTITLFAGQIYSVVLYNQTKNDLIAYSNTAIYNVDGTLKIEDNSVDVTIPCFGYKENGSAYRLEVSSFGTVGENTKITLQNGAPYTFKLYNETRNHAEVYNHTQAFKQNSTLEINDEVWGKFFNVRLFTGMGMAGAGFEMFFSRKISAFAGTTASMLSFVNPKFSSTDILLTPVADINYYFLDFNNGLRVSAGATVFMNFYMSPTASQSMLMDRYGLGLQAGMDFSFLFLKAGLTYSLIPDQQLSPFFMLGVRL